jgi:curved DNA-binding protein CbpA
MNSQKPLKNYYETLEVDPLCSPEELRHAFRRQVALSHPDKVSHLAREIRELATLRTAELTEAYKVLSDETRRSAYDRQIGESPDPAEEIGGSGDAGKAGLGIDDFLRKTALARLRAAVQQTLPGAQEVAVEGFDAAFVARRKWGILSSGTGCGHVLARVLPDIDSTSVQDEWRRALKHARTAKGDTYLFLLGMTIERAEKLSGAILTLQRRFQAAAETRFFIVPLDLNSFDALVPNGAPDPLRAIVKALR